MLERMKRRMERNIEIGQSGNNGFRRGHIENVKTGNREAKVGMGILGKSVN